MTDTKFGGCPACGKASCAAQECRFRDDPTLKDKILDVAQAACPELCVDQALEAHTDRNRALLKEKNQPPGEGLPFGIIDPDYARVFTQARCVAWQYGYTCVMHGSFTRDLDLLLVPWTKEASGHETQLLKLIAIACNLTLGDGEEDIYKANPKWTEQPHGRRSCSLFFKGFGDRRWIDLSVMSLAAEPKLPQPEEDLPKSVDPLDWRLPCDLTAGGFTIGKGCSLRTVQHRLQAQHDANILLMKGQDRADVADTELLDWLESEVLTSYTGVSIDKSTGVPRGFRFLRHHYSGTRKPTLREAIEHARKDLSEKRGGV